FRSRAASATEIGLIPTVTNQLGDWSRGTFEVIPNCAPGCVARIDTTHNRRGHEARDREQLTAPMMASVLQLMTHCLCSQCEGLLPLGYPIRCDRCPCNHPQEPPYCPQLRGSWHQ